MSWQEDIDFLVGKKSSAPKQGRRAGLPKSPETTEQLLDSALESIAYASPRDVPPQARKTTGGWADEAIKSAKSRGSSSNLIEQERFREKSIDSENDDIPVIPDIDDLQEEVANPRDIKMPAVLINTSTYRELDRELSNFATTPNSLQSLSKSGDINLSLLFKQMRPEKDVQETDEEWDMESLFNDIIATGSNV